MINNDISVIVPAYNSAQTIYNCLNALKEQSLLSLEIIVVDDGSTDKTTDIAKEWAIVIPNVRQKGAAGARNSGAYIAKGNILAFIDSDCIPPTNWLKNIISVFYDVSIGAVGGGYSSGVGNTFWQRFCYEELVFRRRNRSDEVKTLVSNNFACRKSFFLEEHGFPEQYPVCEDMLLSYRISQKSKIIWLNNNGVQHHFKNSLKDYLKHQYFFGAESTRFFLQNPKVLFANNHQGKKLYVATIVAFLSVLTGSISVIFFLINSFILAQIFLIIFSLLFCIHFLLYSKFIRYLAKVKFLNITKAYIVSFLRDLICAISFIDGTVRAFTRPR